MTERDDRTKGIEELASLLAFNRVHKQRSDAQETDLDWRLIAAQHGSTEDDYIEMQIAIVGTEFLTELQKLPDAIQDTMIDVFLIAPAKQSSANHEEIERALCIQIFGHPGEMKSPLMVARNDEPPKSNVVPFRRKRS